MAQAKSENISANVAWGIHQRMRTGTYAFRYTFGYKKNKETGKPEIDTNSSFEALNIRCVLLVGNYSKLSKAERKCFEIYRNEMRSVEIICFDELLAKINLMLELFEKKSIVTIDDGTYHFSPLGWVLLGGA